MAGLRERIQSLRLRNIDSKNFVPAGSLNSILSNDVVAQAVKECNFPKYRQSEVASWIVQGGRRTFAILIMIRQEFLMLNFVEKDQLQDAWADSKLPFSRLALEKILPTESAIDFFDNQWEFVSPIFSPSKGHRHLDDHIILPFFDNLRQRGDGGFGLVSEIDVHPKHIDCAKAVDNKVCLMGLKC